MTEAEPDRVSLLLGTYLFEDLSQAELEPLARAATIRRLVRGEYVFHVGDPADEICVVVGGELKDSVLTEDGEEVVHSVYGPGMVFGEPGFFSPERNRVMAMIAVEPTTILVLRHDDVMPFLQRHPRVVIRALEGVSSIARHQTELIAALARRPLHERLLLRLLELAETSASSPDGEGITPKISQATLAAMVGVSRENVNRALGALFASGRVRFEGGRYVLPDPDGLREEIAQGWPLLERLNRRTDS
jgi:CRP/FNR family cyclic AMP-dependent transcriptional regulator